MIDTLINQAEQAHAAGNLQQAWQLYQQVLQRQPQQPAALGNLGIIALETGNVDVAESMLQQALAIQTNPDWQAALALTLQRKGKIPDAIDAMQRAVDMDPEYALFHCRLADMYSISGEVDAAINTYKKALHDADYAAEALYGLSMLAESGDFSFDKNLQQQLTAALATACFDNRLTPRLHFAQAILQHRHGDFDAAFEHYSSANQLRIKQRSARQQYDAKLEQRKFELMRSAFSDELFARQQHSGHDSEYPVFLVGLPRSGTSLLTAMLSNHPAIDACGEMPHMRNLARSGFRVASGQPFPQNVGELDRTAMHAAGDWFLQAMPPASAESKRGIDKMPSNYELLGLIWLLFPRARILHLQRDAMDTLWSCYRHDLALNFTNDFASLAHTHKLYRQYMALWHERLPLPILDIHYEELIADPEQQLRQLVAFLDLPWDERCLSEQRSKLVIDTASRSQARKPIYQDAVRSWQKYARHLQPLQQLIADQKQ